MTMKIIQLWRNMHRTCKAIQVVTQSSIDLAMLQPVIFAIVQADKCSARLQLNIWP